MLQPPSLSEEDELVLNNFTTLLQNFSAYNSDDARSLEASLHTIYSDEADIPIIQNCLTTLLEISGYSRTLLETPDSFKSSPNWKNPLKIFIRLCNLINFDQQTDIINNYSNLQNISSSLSKMTGPSRSIIFIVTISFLLIISI